MAKTPRDVYLDTDVALIHARCRSSTRAMCMHARARRAVCQTRGGSDTRRGGGWGRLMRGARVHGRGLVVMRRAECMAVRLLLASPRAKRGVLLLMPTQSPPRCGQPTHARRRQIHPFFARTTEPQTHSQLCHPPPPPPPQPQCRSRATTSSPTCTARSTATLAGTLLQNPHHLARSHAHRCRLVVASHLLACAPTPLASTHPSTREPTAHVIYPAFRMPKLIMLSCGVCVVHHARGRAHTHTHTHTHTQARTLVECWRWAHHCLNSPRL
jgi:hypothetical protein